MTLPADPTTNVSPMCRREEHHDCVWFEYDGAGLQRAYWCECECHGTVARTEIDLTNEGGSGAAVEVPSVDRGSERVNDGREPVGVGSHR